MLRSLGVLAVVALAQGRPICEDCDAQVAQVVSGGNGVKTSDTTVVATQQTTSGSLQMCTCSQFVNLNGASVAAGDVACNKLGTQTCMPLGGGCPGDMVTCIVQTDIGNVVVVNQTDPVNPVNPVSPGGACSCTSYANFNGAIVESMPTICQKPHTGVCTPDSNGCAGDFVACNNPVYDPTAYPVTPVNSATPAGPAGPVTPVTPVAQNDGDLCACSHYANLNGILLSTLTEMCQKKGGTHGMCYPTQSNSGSGSSSGWCPSDSIVCKLLYPPSTPPPLPTLPPFPPLPNGTSVIAVQATTVSFYLTLAGDVSNFDASAQADLKEELKTSLGCAEPACYITLIVGSGSVAVQTVVSYPVSEVADPTASIAQVEQFLSQNLSAIAADLGLPPSDVVGKTTAEVKENVMAPITVAPPPPASPSPSRPEPSLPPMPPAAPSPPSTPPAPLAPPSPTTPPLAPRSPTTPPLAPPSPSPPAAPPASPSPSLPSGNFAAVYGIKKDATRQIDIFAFAGFSRVIGPQGRWKALSVAFTGGEAAEIESVEMLSQPSSAPSQSLVTQHEKSTTGPFFHTADLAGGTFANGLVATVTFKPGVAIADIHVDLDSFNTYVVQLEDASSDCNATTSCVSLPAIYFGGASKWGFIVMTTTNEVYAFNGPTSVTQATVAFNHDGVEAWNISVPSDAKWQTTVGPTAFGFWSMEGTGVPTGVKLGQVSAPGDACVGPCIDPLNSIATMEDLSSPPQLYNLVYVYGAPVPTFVDPCSTCGALQGSTTTSSPDCIPSSTNDVDGNPYCVSKTDSSLRCYVASPCEACDLVGSSPSNASDLLPMESLLTLCKPTGTLCDTGLGVEGACWQGEQQCVPASCYSLG